MTDADVDGAHIRTLLLTFLFRQMPLLFTNNMIYIAQPPLYEVREKGKKKSEYILQEAKMRKLMLSYGLKGTELIITNGDKKRKLAGSKLKELVEILTALEKLVRVLVGRGIDFHEFVRAYYDKKQLPRFLVRLHDAAEEAYFDKDEYEKRIDELKQREEIDEDSSGATEELREVDRINTMNRKLMDGFDLDLRDFLLNPAGTVLGESAPMKFCLVNSKEEYSIEALGNICPTIRQIGAKGVEIKRFKGLGEMTAGVALFDIEFFRRIIQCVFIRRAEHSRLNRGSLVDFIDI